MSTETGYPKEGGCACGAVRYRLTTAPMYVHCCHCRSCQQETGSAFALNIIIEADNAELIQGRPETIVTPSQSGAGQKIVRCPDCKVAVWSHYAGPAEAVSFVRAGSLDAASDFAPDVHIFTRSKHPWINLPPDVPSFSVYYDPKELWSAGSLERRKAVGWKA
jgi:hypothetical protein